LFEKREEIITVVNKFPKIREKVEDGLLNEPKAEGGMSTAQIMSGGPNKESENLE